MSLQGKKIGISLPSYQLKEPLILQQINNLMDRGAEAIIMPRKNSSLQNYTDNMGKISSQGMNLLAGAGLISKNERSFSAFLSYLDIIVFCSAPGELLKCLISQKSPFPVEDIPIVLALEAEIRGRFPSLSQLSCLLQQKGIYFVPFGTVYRKEEDKEIINLCSRADLITDTCSAALKNVQIRPVIWENHGF